MSAQSQFEKMYRPRTLRLCGGGEGALKGHPPVPFERVEGVWGNREVPPRWTKEGGNVGETWFPPRERAEGERRSLAEPGEAEAAEAHVAEHLLRLRLDACPRRAERLVHSGEDEVGERLRILRVDRIP